MLQGAIIGAIAGIVAALVMLLMQARRSKRLLALLASGDLDAARAQLDRWHPPVDKIPLSKIVAQSERMAGLTLLGDIAAIDAEVRSHTGNISAVAQVDSVGLLGLALLGDASQAAHRLDELSQRCEAEGGRSLTVVKKKVALLAELGRALAGQPLDDGTVTRLDKLAGAQGKLPKLVVLQALGEAFERQGKSQGARAFKQRVRQETRVFG